MSRYEFRFDDDVDCFATDVTDVTDKEVNPDVIVDCLLELEFEYGTFNYGGIMIDGRWVHGYHSNEVEPSRRQAFLNEVHDAFRKHGYAVTPYLVEKPLAI